MTLLYCKDGLIGDFLGFVPVITELAKQDELHLVIHPESAAIFSLIPKKLNISQQQPVHYNRILKLDAYEACKISHIHNYYMSQAHFAYLGMPVPSIPPKAELEYEAVDVALFDYILAPFSRSLPSEQHWPKEQWQKLVDQMPQYSFCIIGHERDDHHFIAGNNVTGMFNKPIVQIINVLKRARRGLISIVSGPSHLAFHLGVKNYLLTNQQMTWGNNPDAIQVRDYLPALTAERLSTILQTF
ncbi:hypothetical protein QTN47_11640 [Danxiaibacter flavus]|uniref:ADP-heptose:LPS heptosyltransferase n=1 Tax=Danxiaibacter flavus TaxID=3049108 RepID=A0ABV3ZEA4_9BACT|nr:hypothetical protein QNM32_11645 [Chitinophagaceae bacterium DXS]